MVPNETSRPPAHFTDIVRMSRWRGYRISNATDSGICLSCRFGLKRRIGNKRPVANPVSLSPAVFYHRYPCAVYFSEWDTIHLILHPGKRIASSRV